MKKNSGLHLLYKKLGETPLQAIDSFKRANPEYKDKPMTYAGRLDPMAEGLLLVLSGEEIKNKDTYQDLPKTYEMEVLWGFETDSLDVLGIISVSPFSTHLSKDTDIFLLENSSSSLRRASPVPSQDAISTNLLKLVGKFEQKYPAYSSRTVQGKPLFQWAREGKISEVKAPAHQIEVLNANFLERKEISGSEILKSVEEKISKVSGDFRQKEILNLWQTTLSRTVLDSVVLDKIRLTVSSGFYVRQFVSDLAESLGTKAVTFHIKRTKVGDFAVDDYK